MALKIKSLEEHSRPSGFDEVRVKEMGNIIEVKIGRASCRERV